jgi:Xaa-Pro aminopeptidase
MTSALRTTTLLLGFLPLAAAATPTPGPDQESGGVLVRSLERPGDGSEVCGLGREFHAGRRTELRRRLEKGWILFRGLPGARGPVPFRQDKQFWYLTGIESPDAALLMDAETGREVVFLPDRDVRTERWDGELWDSEDPWVSDLTGIEDVRPSSKLMEVLGDLLSENDVVWTSFHPVLAMAGSSDYAERYDQRRAQDPLDGRPSRADALEEKLVQHFDVEVRDCSQALIAMRWVKTEEEVAAMRRAGRAGALAMVEAMRSTRPGLGEWELASLMSLVHVREGAAGPAYGAIVGSGANSCVLHYGANDRRMRSGEVVLIDFGCELDHYTTDITRTWPVGGELEGRAAEMYDAVLAAQEAGIAAARPGGTMNDVDAAARAVLRERGFGDLILHGTCHWIGLEVHDPGPRVGGASPKTLPLVPGVAFTVEPGIYDAEAGIGIRIEDVVVITEDGCEVLTADVPKARAEVEELVGSEGLLGRMDAAR